MQAILFDFIFMLVLIVSSAHFRDNDNLSGHKGSQAGNL